MKRSGFKSKRRALAVVFTFRDGREVCNRKCPAGKALYASRVEEMRQRQDGRCCLEGIAPMCPGVLYPHHATFEHEFGCGMSGGKRDDRTELPAIITESGEILRDRTLINGAAHLVCNQWKGSRYYPYNEARNAAIAGKIAQEVSDGIEADCL